ncbi:MAG TPA: 30S ribosomal protein S1 [bacterium]|nr:30S ribosomal protein S1 [bacterium]
MQEEKMTSWMTKQMTAFKPGQIITGKVIEVANDYVLIDIGYKSEGYVPRMEFKDFETLESGQEVRVMLETLDINENGFISLSKEKADLLLNWDRVETSYRQGETIKGKILASVKGGFRVDIGIMAFLPISQTDIRPISDPKALIGQVFDFKVIKLDRSRNNIVISRRELLEAEERIRKTAALARLEIGQVVKGLVKNIVDYGAFIDIGDLTGLAHINDLSWSHITHPSQVLAIGDRVEVKILKINQEKGEVSLGLKQTMKNPWEGIESRYPVGSRIQGKVVNITDYGAFVKLEDGVEGLLHISELSWTNKVKHPSEILAMGDTIEVQVIALDQDKQKISFSMKALEPNPWDTIAEKYQVNSVVKGRVYNVTNYGAFVELEKGIEGLLHISNLDWSKVKHPSEILKKGDRIEVMILDVDPVKRRIALGRKQLINPPAPESDAENGEAESEEKSGEEPARE